jgi:indolepyruvate ferredoxin oxidoreductase
MTQPTTPPRDVALRDYKLSDNLGAHQGQVFLTGTQALVRLLLAQKALDERAGLKTAGFVSGYRGSPLGMVDQHMLQELDVARGEAGPAESHRLRRRDRP